MASSRVGTALRGFAHPTTSALARNEGVAGASEAPAGIDLPGKGYCKVQALEEAPAAAVWAKPGRGAVVVPAIGSRVPPAARIAKPGPADAAPRSVSRRLEKRPSSSGYLRTIFL